MSTIKELGGYEKAKEVQKQRALDGLLHDYDWELFDELLEYRREHNIFEVGDWVVSTLNTGSRPESMVCKIEFTHNGIVTTTSKCGEIVNFYNSKFKHATDAEIKQGYRE